MPAVAVNVVLLRIEPLIDVANTVHSSSASIGEFSYAEDNR